MKIMYKLEKLTDDVFNDHHPNFILEGMYWVGRYISSPKVGERFRFGTGKDHPREHLYTSIVTKLIDKNTFKTKNSTYSLKKLIDDD